MAQTYSDIQIIVVDDSPADWPEKEKVRQAVQDTCPEALYISYGENRGAPFARNTGIQHATGEYVAFLDDDDEWTTEKIQKQLEGFVNAETALVYGQEKVINEIEGYSYRHRKKQISGWVYEQLLERNFIGSTSNPMMRRDYVDAVGGFDEEMRSFQDYDLFLRLAQQYEVQFVPELCLIYHVHDGDRISTTFSDKVAGSERLIQKYARDLERNPRAWANHHRKLVVYYKRIGDQRKALRIWRSSVRKAPAEIRSNIYCLLRLLFPPDFLLFRWHHRRNVRKLKKDMASEKEDLVYRKKDGGSDDGQRTG